MKIDEKNPYLIMTAGGSFFENAPMNLKKYKDVIMKASEWIEHNFQVKNTERMYKYEVINVYKYWYSFEYCFSFDISDDPQFKEAIKEKKKYLTFEYDVYFARKMGSDYSEIVNQPNHIVSFCDSHLLLDQEDYQSALEKIKCALLEKPNYYNYKLLYFEIQFKREEINTIDEVLDYYCNDVDSIIHSGVLIKWLKLLFKYKKYEKIVIIIENVNKSIDGLIDGKITPQLHSSQFKETYMFEKKKFNKEADKILKKIDKQLKK